MLKQFLVLGTMASRRLEITTAEKCSCSDVIGCGKEVPFSRIKNACKHPFKIKATTTSEKEVFGF